MSRLFLVLSVCCFLFFSCLNDQVGKVGLNFQTTGEMAEFSKKRLLYLAEKIPKGIKFEERGGLDVKSYLKQVVKKGYYDEALNQVNIPFDFRKQPEEYIPVSGNLRDFFSQCTVYLIADYHRDAKAFWEEDEYSNSVQKRIVKIIQDSGFSLCFSEFDSDNSTESFIANANKIAPRWGFYEFNRISVEQVMSMPGFRDTWFQPFWDDTSITIIGCDQSELNAISHALDILLNDSRVPREMLPLIEETHQWITYNIRDAYAVHKSARVMAERKEKKVAMVYGYVHIRTLPKSLAYYGFNVKILDPTK